MSHCEVGGKGEWESGVYWGIGEKDIDANHENNRKVIFKVSSTDFPSLPLSKKNSCVVRGWFL